jgi:hypothetical protein
MMRKVICHYHIFKNSGTSFDNLLTINFGDRHICFDGPFPFFHIDQEELSKIIIRKKDVVAFSSHQIQLPVPVSLNFVVLPVVFLRHPLLRVQSIYKFKRLTYDGTPTSKNAREMSFDEWVGYSFSDRLEVTHISNAQTRFLSSAYRQKPLIRRTPSGMEYDIYQAIRNIENVKLIGRTEFFDQDVGRFTSELKKHGVDFKFEKINPQNITTKNHELPLDERLRQVEQSLSGKNYKNLLEANLQDMQLFDYTSRLIDGS